MTRIPADLRRIVYHRARGHCEYCKAPIEIVIAAAIDHIRPEIRGGQTISENLCLACHLCNGSKLYFTTGTDPQTGKEEALFNPREQRWQEHFEWQENFTRIVGLTPYGRATIHRLKLNREAFIRARKRWLESGWLPPKD